MTDHRTAAEAALTAAKTIPGETTRTELLLQALVHATLALNTAATPASRSEQLLAIIRREGGQWDGQRLMAACRVAGITGLENLGRARSELRALAEGGLLVQVSAPRARPVYELADSQ